MNQSVPVKIVILYAEVVGYVVGMLKALEKCDVETEIDVVFWDNKTVNSSRFIINENDRIKFHARSSLTEAELTDLLNSRMPDIVFVSGWMDRGYTRAIRRYRSEGGEGQVVCGIDAQWEGTLRQHIGRIYFQLFYSKMFDFMWVTGKPQYHIAQRFGYKHERIITNLYSADTDIFKDKSTFSKRFVFIGRFDPVKALDQLLDAYLSLPEDVQSEWPLVLIGDGQLKDDIERRKSENIVVKPFMQPDSLLRELMHGGVSCITSHHENWGVAIHEMAILGFPFVLSSACGAATEFLISGYNGFLFKCSNTGSLRDALLKTVMLSDDKLDLFSQRSHALGRRITSEYAAYSLLSVIPLSKV